MSLAITCLALYALAVLASIIILIIDGGGTSSHCAERVTKRRIGEDLFYLDKRSGIIYTSLSIYRDLADAFNAGVNF